MTKTEKRIEFIKRLGHLIDFAVSQDIDVIFTAVYRTAEEQNKLYNEKKSLLDGYTKISNHQRWLAVDVVIVVDGQLVWDRVPEYERLGEFWTEHGGTWGGNWESLNDIYHFEYNPA